MEDPDVNSCDLPSDVYYKNLESVEKAETYKSHCDSHDNLLDKYPELKMFCWKLASHLVNLNKKDPSVDMEKQCAYLKHLLHYKVINTFEIKSPITYMTILHSVWLNIMEDRDVSINSECKIKFPAISIDYITKWKKIHDYNNNYQDLKNTLDSKTNCIEKYCKDIADITNIYNEFLHVCTETKNERCPHYWEEFKKNYEETPKIDAHCQKEYEKLGYYKVKKYFGEQGIEEYIEQYESEYIFSFFERLIGYSLKHFLSKALSFFGSKIAPKVDDMRKMWRNVQGLTNPASLLNPMKPPGGGNKMGLSYMSK
ncbi:PIR protein [Plasmodium ovale]|uniref:PIR protein n=1 Tax=Plasmodium ovale TaxID=36330 RepID=A0A1C3KKR5_PLAOA|nr:PIR protein [Plasmodium ovale]